MFKEEQDFSTELDFYVNVLDFDKATATELCKFKAEVAQLRMMEGKDHDNPETQG